MTDTQYPKGATALLCIDPYNDFLAEGGKMWPALAEVATSVGLHANLSTVRAAARKAGMPIFILPHHRHHATDFEGWAHLTPSQAAAHQYQLFAEGTWGGEWYDGLAPTLNSSGRGTVGDFAQIGLAHRAGHPGGGLNRHVLQMRLKAAGRRIAARAGVKAPGDEADQFGIVQDVFDQPHRVAVAVPVGVAQLGADFGAAAVGPLEFDRRQAPIHAGMRRRMGHRVCPHRGLVTGVAGQGFGPDPAVARIDRHAVDAARRLERTPKWDVVFAHMAIDTAGVGQDRMDAVPGGQPLLGRDGADARQRGEVETVLTLGKGKRSKPETGRDDQGNAGSHAKSTVLLKGISRGRWPVAAKMASARAGAAGAVAGSPRPRTRSARPRSCVWN